MSRYLLAGQFSTDVHASVAGSSHGRAADSIGASHLGLNVCKNKIKINKTFTQHNYITD